MSKEERRRKSIMNRPGRKERRARRLPTSFRCMMVFEQGAYYAECVDLNLLVKADSATEAKEKLEALVDDYLGTVREMGYPEHLVYRRSPLRSRLKYYRCVVIVVLAHLLHRNNGDGSSASCETLRLAAA